MKNKTSKKEISEIRKKYGIKPYKRKKYTYTKRRETRQKKF